MANLPRVLGVVPARAGSKGLAGKNLRPLAGLPLIGHTLRAAALMDTLTRCIVSTDSDEIAAVARGLGGDVPFRRPAELAMDDTPMAPVLRHALAQAELEEAAPYDLVVLLDPTSPARDPVAVDAAVAKLMDHSDLDGVVSVSRPSFHPVWVGVRPAPDNQEQLERYFAAGQGLTRRQELDPFLRINGNFYVWRAEFVRRLRTSWFDEGRHGFVEIADRLGIGVDSLSDFEILEALIGAGLLDLAWLRRSRHG